MYKLVREACSIDVDEIFLALSDQRFVSWNVMVAA
jgi:hypothetical protein